ncbi:MAG: flippase-like domain-containing protein [Deltaproteobacteria bacterium]|nr:flippase-like domain-containing protein [Deltaproteobacteria bacterium]
MTRQRWTSLLVFAITLAAGVYFFSRFAGSWSQLVGFAGRVTPPQWLAIAAGALTFYFCDYLRFYCLLRIFGIRLGVWPGIKLTCITYLVADLTPNSELHFPFVVFLLAREGVPVPVAAAVSLTKSLAMMLWVCALSYLSLQLNPDVALPAAVARHLPLYLTPLFSMATVLALVIVAPNRARGLCARVLAHPKLAGWLRKIVAGLDRTASALATVGRSRHPMHLLCHLATLVAVAAYVSVGYVLCRSLQPDVSLGRAISAFTSGLFLGYTSPVPGSIGIGEGIESYLLDPAMQPGSMAVAVLHRMACWYSIWLRGNMAGKFSRAPRPRPARQTVDSIWTGCLNRA